MTRDKRVVAAVGVRAHGWGWRHVGRSTPALAGVDLVIEPGERVLIAGPSGSGKSTLVAAIAGVLEPHAGVATGVLQVVPDPRMPDQVTGVRAPVGLLVQDPSSQILLSRVADDIAFGPENLAVPREQIDDRVRSAMADVRLDLPWRHNTRALSGGQTQRVALAGLLAMQPGLLVLDEPTSALDPSAMRVAWERIADVVERTGATLIMVEHRLDLLLAQHGLIERVIVVDGPHGVVADAAPEEILQHHRQRLTDLGLWLPGEQIVRRQRTETVVRPEVLTAQQVSVRHPGAAAPAVIDADLMLRHGQVCALVGPNGSGKSTLALAMAGLIPRLTGQVRAAPDLAGTASVDPAEWKARERVARVGVVFQNPEHQFVTGRVIDELATGPRVLGLSEPEVVHRVEDLLTRLRLTHVADANPFTLSGGEQRRLSVATALSAGASVLILDEPTYGQDRQTWNELVDLIAQVRERGSSVLMVTHDEPLIEALADTVVRMEAGRVVT